MHYLLYFLIPFGISLTLTPIVRFFALRNGFISYPRADRWHKHPTASLGGISIYLASLVPAFFIKIPDRRILGLLIGATFLFLVGLTDDKFHLKPYTNLFCQIIAGCVAVAYGVILGLPKDNFISIPLTLVWIVLVTNSFNLLDNIDGLAAGIAGIAAFMLFISSIVFSFNPFGIYGLILAGASFGFLPYNFNPAKIFMGDSGSMFLGFSLAVISVLETHHHISGLLTTLFIPVFILSVPIFDTIFVTILRKLQGRSVFEGGKDHTSHHLVTLGLSQRKAVLLLYAISISFGLIAILYSRINTLIISITAFLGITLLFYFGTFLSDSVAFLNRQSKNQRKHNGDVTVLTAVLLHKRRVAEIITDLAFVCVAYTASYFLRFEEKLLPANLQLMKESLPWIILLKMSVFFIFGLYRGTWRYVSISDLITIFKATTLASIGSILFLTFLFRFQEYSRAVFIIDWFILLFLISASRISFRVLGEFFSRLGEKGKNVLIFGAGDMGETVVREIKRNKSLHYNPIGFIDDDLKKNGIRIQGIGVLGPRGKIRDLIKENDIKEIIVAIPSIGAQDLSEISKLCNEYGISYRIVKGILDEDNLNGFIKN
jgi:UDP-GlcNAc:undecaprenyl-phosphate GlcNAc-1-phosphate transferase